MVPHERLIKNVKFRGWLTLEINSNFTLEKLVISEKYSKGHP
jgi:hypothetical protein